MIINPAKQIHGQEEIKAATAVIESGRWAEGDSVQQFEKALGEYVGMKYVRLVNSGTSANFAALMALTTRYIPEDRRLKIEDWIRSQRSEIRSQKNAFQ